MSQLTARKSQALLRDPNTEQAGSKNEFGDDQLVVSGDCCGICIMLHSSGQCSRGLISGQITDRFRDPNPRHAGGRDLQLHRV